MSFGVCAAWGPWGTLLGATGRPFPTGAEGRSDRRRALHVRIPYDGPTGPETGPRTPVHAELVTSRVDTMQLMFAAGEMQTSGEPLANLFAGRNLPGYLRWYLPPNLYFVQSSGSSYYGDGFLDLFGFSTAIESYEYSKYHMNMVANQTGAGVSLANGPLIARQPGATPFDRLRARVEQLIIAAGTNVGGFATIPDGGATNRQNDFGFPGLWPNLYPYRSFNPSMTPDLTIAHSCTTVSGYGGLQMFGNNAVPAYECFYNSLQLNDRVAQSEPVIGPGCPRLHDVEGSALGHRLHRSTSRLGRQSGHDALGARRHGAHRSSRETPCKESSPRPPSRARSSARRRSRGCGA